MALAVLGHLIFRGAPLGTTGEAAVQTSAPCCGQPIPEDPYAVILPLQEQQQQGQAQGMFPLAQCRIINLVGNQQCGYIAAPFPVEVPVGDRATLLVDARLATHCKIAVQSCPLDQLIFANEKPRHQWIAMDWAALQEFNAYWASLGFPFFGGGRRWSFLS